MKMSTLYVADAVKRQVGHVRSINPSQRHVLGVLCLLRTTTADLTCQSPATEFLQPLNPRPLVVTISLSLSVSHLSASCYASHRKSEGLKVLKSVEEIHSVDKINNVETSYFTQLKMCYLMTTFRCPSHILITS